MRLTYFEDVDTLDIWFGDEEGPVYNTVDGPDESILLYYDEEGRLLGLTVDHASRNLRLEHLRQTPGFRVASEV